MMCLCRATMMRKRMTMMVMHRMNLNLMKVMRDCLRRLRDLRIRTHMEAARSTGIRMASSSVQAAVVFEPLERVLLALLSASEFALDCVMRALGDSNSEFEKLNSNSQKIAAREKRKRDQSRRKRNMPKAQDQSRRVHVSSNYKRTAQHYIKLPSNRQSSRQTD